jgi:plasmid stabilization system protein ParE
MIGYRFLLPAEEEMTEASLFYERRSARLGVDFLDEVDRAIALLRDYPTLGQIIEGALRQVTLHRFPFNIFYAVEADAIVIVAVAHQSRHPGYWRERVAH